MFTEISSWAAADAVMISSVPTGFSPTPPSVLLSGLAGAGKRRAGWLVRRAPMRAA